MADLIYDAPPTLATFMKSDAFGRIAAGPVGSGKTTACMMELLRRSLLQSTAQDGCRYTRFAVVRQTLKSLKDTVLKDCETWLGARGLGSCPGSAGGSLIVFAAGIGGCGTSFVFPTASGIATPPTVMVPLTAFKTPKPIGPVQPSIQCSVCIGEKLARFKPGFPSQRERALAGSVVALVYCM